MPIYKQTTEITKIDDVWANIDRDIVEVYFGNKNIFTVWSEYTSSLPITINANGDALLDYRIYGTDSGVGVATENLFNAQGTDNYGYYNNANGQYINNRNYKHWRFPVKEGDVIRWTTNKAGWGCYFSNGVYRGGFYTDSTPFTVPANVDEITNSFNSAAWDSAMVTKNQPLPETYIPYGYKLPITVGDGDTAQTVPVYIGENQLDSVEGVADYVDKSSGKIVRRIKEYTFTGNENWTAYGVGFYTSGFFSDAYQLAYQITTRFSHFTARSNVPLSAMIAPSFGDNCGCFWRNYDSVMMRSTTNFTTAEECKAYFKAQYDNGTPVKMWYILATPTEEDPPVPLPEIPTIDGTTVIDYDGDPKPSQMYVKYRKQYS